MDDNAPARIPGHSRCRATRSGLIIGPHGRPLKPWLTRDGYQTVKVWRDTEAKRCSVSVHDLILLTFAGPKPGPKMVARHLDGNRQNNSAANLRWGTSSENAHDTARHGRANWLIEGVDRPGTRLTNEQAIEISERARAGENTADLATEFGITRKYVYNLRDHKNRAYLWRDSA